MCVCVCEAADSERERERERERGGGYREEKAFPFSNRRDAQKRASSIQRTDAKVPAASTFIITPTSAKIFSLFDADVLTELCLC